MTKYLAADPDDACGVGFRFRFWLRLGFGYERFGGHVSHLAFNLG